MWGACVDRVPAIPRVALRNRRLGEHRRLRACYEAGPNGYGLHRQLVSLGVRCDVVEPALILLFGGAVGFVALALLQAIYGLNARVL